MFLSLQIKVHKKTTLIVNEYLFIKKENQSGDILLLERQRNVSQTQMKFRRFYNIRNSPSDIMAKKFKDSESIAEVNN